MRTKILALVLAFIFASTGQAHALTCPISGFDTNNSTTCSTVLSTLPNQYAGVQLTMYASPCNATVNNNTPTSCFCPVGTDTLSVTKRTYAANYLTPGKSFQLTGGGIYSVPAANTNTATISIKVGTYTIVTLTTPAAPVGSNAGITFNATCTVQSNGTSITCNGQFVFTVAGATYTPVPIAGTGTFDPTQADTVDVLGNWNGTVTTQTTTVTDAVLTALN